jgi:hypothetical protein
MILRHYVNSRGNGMIFYGPCEALAIEKGPMGRFVCCWECAGQRAKGGSVWNKRPSLRAYSQTISVQNVSRPRNRHLLALTRRRKKFAAERHLGFRRFCSVLARSYGGLRPGFKVGGAHLDKRAHDVMAASESGPLKCS